MMDVYFFSKLFLWAVTIVGSLWVAVKLFLGAILNKAFEEGIRTLFLKEQTKIVEAVKEDFGKRIESFKKDLQLDIAKEIEPLKALLDRENIAFQITHTELTKERFTTIAELYAKAYEMKKFVERSLTGSSRLYTSNKEKAVSLNREYTDIAFLSSLYLSHDTNNIIQQMIGVLPSVVEIRMEYESLQDTYNSVEVGDVADVIQYDVDDEPRYILWKEEDISQLDNKIKFIKQTYNEQLQLFEEISYAIDVALKSTLQNS